MAIRGSTRHLDEKKDNELGWSAIVRANGFLFLAGIAAVDDTRDALVGEGDPVAQINWIYDTMEKVLALYGATLEHVVQEQVFVTDYERIEPALVIRKQRYAPYKLPATAGCEVSSLDTPGALIEVMATALDPATIRK